MGRIYHMITLCLQQDLKSLVSSLRSVAPAAVWVEAVRYLTHERFLCVSPIPRGLAKNSHTAHRHASPLDADWVYSWSWRCVSSACDPPGSSVGWICEHTLDSYKVAHLQEGKRDHELVPFHWDDASTVNSKKIGRWDRSTRLQFLPYCCMTAKPVDVGIRFIFLRNILLVSHGQN